MSSKEVWLILGALATVVLCDTAAPLTVFTVPRIRLNISSLMSSSQASEQDGNALDPWEDSGDLSSSQLPAAAV